LPGKHHLGSNEGQERKAILTNVATAKIKDAVCGSSARARYPLLVDRQLMPHRKKFHLKARGTTLAESQWSSTSAQSAGRIC
jgi:hypothetical protein